MEKLMTTLSQHPFVVWPLRIAALLWLVWGLVHAIAGIATMLGDPPGNIQAIADAVPPANLALAYPDAVGAILTQHGLNLFWFGAVTTACAMYIWQRRTLAVAPAALIGGLADLGYFLFLDLGGYVNFVPGTLMTLVSSGAIALSVFAWYVGRRAVAC
jgi:hypothetical protein